MFDIKIYELGTVEEKEIKLSDTLLDKNSLTYPDSFKIYFDTVTNYLNKKL